MKNSATMRTARAIPTGTGRRRWRTSSSSRQPSISGNRASDVVIRWAKTRLLMTNGENP